ncbi:MAG: hypothetical protein JRJ29_00475 [Deltaproteobacteria bacterium]|nr:hypothetical protein [Deltaproteobacteria bacterium]
MEERVVSRIDLKRQLQTQFSRLSEAIEEAVKGGKKVDVQKMTEAARSTAKVLLFKQFLNEAQEGNWMQALALAAHILDRFEPKPTQSLEIKTDEQERITDEEREALKEISKLLVEQAKSEY